MYQCPRPSAWMVLGACEALLQPRGPVTQVRCSPKDGKAQGGGWPRLMILILSLLGPFVHVLCLCTADGARIVVYQWCCALACRSRSAPVAPLSSRFCVTVFPALPVATFGPDTWMVFGGKDAVRTPRLYEAEDVTLFAYVLS
jgi:hypothetical protein